MQGTALIILDGWGIAPPGPGNCVAAARTPVTERLDATCPRIRLRTSGRAVGLPEGQMGNSEVGHLTLGAGRVIPMDLVRVGDAIEDGSFYESEPLNDALAGWVSSRSTGVDTASSYNAPSGHSMTLSTLQTKCYPS